LEGLHVPSSVSLSPLFLILYNNFLRSVPLAPGSLSRYRLPESFFHRRQVDFVTVSTTLLTDDWRGPSRVRLLLHDPTFLFSLDLFPSFSSLICVMPQIESRPLLSRYLFSCQHFLNICPPLLPLLIKGPVFECKEAPDLNSPSTFYPQVMLLLSSLVASPSIALLRT